MDNDRFQPQPKVDQTTETKVKTGKDPFAEPPIKDYSHLLSAKARPSKKQHRTMRIVGLVLLLVIVLGVGAYFGYKRFHKTPPAQPAATVQKQTATSNNAAPPTIPTQSHTSAGYGVTFNYPTSWSVLDNGSTSLNIDSPVMALTAANGSSVSGKIVVAFAPQGQVPASFGTAAATAVLPSQLVKYSNPTSSQRAQTYLSFLQYAATKTIGGLDGIYITGNYGYQKGQDIPRTDVSNLNPIVTVTFGSCTNGTCTTPTPITIKSTMWSDSSFSAPITTILTSLSFQ